MEKQNLSNPPNPLVHAIELDEPVLKCQHCEEEIAGDIHVLTPMVHKATGNLFYIPLCLDCLDDYVEEEEDEEDVGEDV